jgi:hypothetical protein
MKREVKAMPMPPRKLMPLTAKQKNKKKNLFIVHRRGREGKKGGVVGARASIISDR